MSETARREAVTGAQRIVVKVGSSSLTTVDGGLDPARISTLVDVLAAARERGAEVQHLPGARVLPPGRRDGAPVTVDDQAVAGSAVSLLEGIQAAVPSTTPIAAGYSLERRVTPVSRSGLS